MGPKWNARFEGGPGVIEMEETRNKTRTDGQAGHRNGEMAMVTKARFLVGEDAVKCLANVLYVRVEIQRTLYSSSVQDVSGATAHHGVARISRRP